MEVNSIKFFIFFGAVFALYYLSALRSCKWQNVCLLAASLFFYGYISVKMLALLVAVTLVFYGLGLAMGPALSGDGSAATGKCRRKVLAVIGVCLGAGVLVYFKYTNFFIAQISALVKLAGFHKGLGTLDIIVPVGVSFFTFKLISYAVDVYKGKMQPVKDILAFSSWVTFFPTIMSGPIDRAVDTVPQLRVARRYSGANLLEGATRVLWGMFLKMCIADNIASYTDAAFSNYLHHTGVTIAVAALLYSVQIYADFSGYSEMAIGVARILGIKVPENFLRPYFSTNVADFWRRWHMSLMSWLRDYIYFPLGGSRCSQLKTARNTFGVFAVSGLWHGANWTFILWGIYHGALVVLRRVLNKGGKKSGGKTQPQAWWARYLKILGTFLLCTLGWMMFRADSVQQFASMLSRLAVSGSLFTKNLSPVVLPMLILLFKDLKDEEGWHLNFLHSRQWVVRAVSTGLLIAFIAFTGELEGPQFIYFQF